MTTEQEQAHQEQAHKVEDREHRILEQIEWLIGNGYRATAWRILDEIGNKLRKSTPDKPMSVA